MPSHRLTPAKTNRSSRDKAWHAMRKWPGTFCTSDIAQVAGINIINLQHYLYVLEKAGYAVRSGFVPRPGGGRSWAWRIVKDTGPRAPIVRWLEAMWDPNTDYYWSEDPDLARQRVGARSRRRP